MSKFGSWLKKTGGKVLSVAAPIAALGALAIPGVGGAVSNGISKLIGGKAAKIGETAAAAIGGISKPDSSGGLFGKGGLFGTGLLAGREWKEYNLDQKWLKQDKKVLAEAERVLSRRITKDSILTDTEAQNVLAKLEDDLSVLLPAPAPAAVAAAPFPEDDKTGLYLKIGGGLLLAKLFRLF